MLKYEIDSVEGLDEGLANLYEQNEGGKFRLKVDGMPEVDAEEVERYKAKVKEVEKHLKDKDREARKAAEEAARKSGDIQALEQSWQKKLDDALTEKESALNQYQAMVKNLTVGTAATRLASEIAVPGSADVLLPHIERRLAVEIEGDMPKTRVLDAAGNPTAMSLDDLRKELSGNSAFAPIIVGSKASGSGHKPGIGGQQLQRSKMTPEEKASYMKEHGQMAYLQLPK